MYEVVKNVIRSGSYDLSDILKKLDTLWIQGSLTDDQREELSAMARDGADPKNSVDLAEKLKDHEQRLRALEEKLENADSGDTEETEAYPEYVAGKWYYAGDKCSEGGVNYVCAAPEGQVCTWSPSEYPAYWEVAV